MWRKIFQRAAPSFPPGWDRLQASVIARPPTARLLVDGGPGTGKTAVACARVARLLAEERLAPDAIWLISFTRTAIAELRQRIAAAVPPSFPVHQVRISTLDSLAWMLQPDHDDADSYDGNIALLLQQITQRADWGERLAAIRHLVIDEAHDIVGLRAELVAALIDRLPECAGLTVFADEAQAIYGFADDSPGWGRQPLLDRLRGRPDIGKIRLETVFRTRQPGLSRVFGRTRRRVLDQSVPPHRTLETTRREIVRLADGTTEAGRDDRLDGDSLVLFRRRAEVLAASARLHDAGIAHRLRLSGHPAGLAAWIAACLGGIDRHRLSQSAFGTLWQQRIAGTCLETVSPEAAWDSLLALAPWGDGGLNLPLLVRTLARPHPPIELCQGESGCRGPILGTIHASKGREAETVHLMLPQQCQGDHAEEARIAFVGATRARRRLLVGTARPEPATPLPSGRLVRIEDGAAWVELGRQGDIDADGLAGRQWFAGTAAVQAAQARLRSLAASLAGLEGRRAAFGYHLGGPDGEMVAALGATVLDDFDRIARHLSGQTIGHPIAPPDIIPGLRLIGLHTMAIDGNPALHPPYHAGGLLLCPEISTYGRLPFRAL